MAKTYIDEHGYLRFTDSNKAIHRYVAEKKLGRRLRLGEVVHHRDRNKLNNDPGNLKVCSSQLEHEIIHKFDALVYGEKASYQKHSWKNRDRGNYRTFIVIAIALLLIAMSM